MTIEVKVKGKKFENKFKKNEQLPNIYCPNCGNLMAIYLNDHKNKCPEYKSKILIESNTKVNRLSLKLSNTSKF